ncbi:MAG: metallophosphoesterase [Firmicutes bacterium]|nr:metallophosphoesterase [Bacillota bacterium]
MKKFNGFSNAAKASGLFADAQTTFYDIMSHRLPKEFDGFKIAQISDIHSRPCTGICEEIANFSPDIIAITGDLVHDDNKSYDAVTRLIADLVGIAPVYMSSGNHDVWHVGHSRIFREFCSLGAVLLDEKRAILSKNGAHIALFGISDPFSHVNSAICRNVKNSLSALPDFDGYKILLFHRANLFDLIKDAGFDLVLSGHMHGGQIQIPHMGGLLAPSSSIASGSRMIFPKYCSGRFLYDDTTMIVSRGIGNTLPIPRLFNPPEVCAVTLRKN